MKSNKYTSEQLKTMVNDGTLCSVPFRTYELKQGGKHGFCCKWMAPGLTQNGKLLDVSNSTIADAWNGDEMHSIRQAMLEGKQVSACYPCYQEEKSSSASLRLQESNGWLDWLPDQFTKAVNEHIETGKVNDITKMDLRFSTLCNSMCRMCTPDISTNLARETTKIIAKDPGFKNVIFNYSPEWEKETDYGLDSTFMADLQTHLQGVNKLFFLGGETTIIKSVTTLLQSCVDQGIAGNIDVQYSMNCTNTAPHHIELLGQFRSVQLTLSIDAYGGLNDYIRYPSHWSTIEKNVEELVKLPKPFWIVTSPVPMVYNMLHWHELMRFWSDVNENYAVDVFPCHLETPSYMKPNNLPHILLPLALKSLHDSLKMPICQNNEVAVERIKHLLYEITTNPIIEHTQLKRHTDAQDLHRNMFLKDYVPDLAEALEKNVN